MNLALNWLFVNMEPRTRSFASKHIKALCERKYGGEISGSTWSRWRKWAGQSKITAPIPDKAKYLTQAQSEFLYGVAIMRSTQNEEERKQKLNPDTLLDLIQSDEFSQAFMEALDHLGKVGIISGKDAISHFKISESKLRKVVPEFSTFYIYDVRYLELKLLYN